METSEVPTAPKPPPPPTYTTTRVAKAPSNFKDEMLAFEKTTLKKTLTLEKSLESLFAPSQHYLYGLVSQNTSQDRPNVLASKIHKLCKLIAESDKVVFLTGAGISTAASIPDYRSPTGTFSSEFFEESSIIQAVPTISHYAITALANIGKVSGVITGNHDALHSKSGLEENKLIELHGNFFEEVCDKCNKKYTTSAIVALTDDHFTYNTCSVPSCLGTLKNTLVKFGEECRPEIIEKATQLSREADLCIVIGTSMLVKPMNLFPLLAKKFVIINLQEGPMDSQAWLVIRGKSDEVMSEVMAMLEVDYDKPVVEKRGVDVDKWMQRVAYSHSDSDSDDWL